MNRSRSAIDAEEVLGFVRTTELDVPILPREDPRWERLRSRVDPEVGLRDPSRGALIGGAIGDAVRAIAEGSTRLRTSAEHADEISRPRWPQAQGG